MSPLFKRSGQANNGCSARPSGRWISNAYDRPSWLTRIRALQPAQKPTAGVQYGVLLYGRLTLASKKMVSIPGSLKQPLKSAKVIAPAPSDERLEVTVRVRPRNPLPKAQDLLKLSGAPLQQLTHAQYEQRYGADAKDIALVRKFAKEHNLNIVRESAARRSVILAGTVADFNRAFGVSLKTYAYPRGTYRGRTGFIQIPAELALVIEGVFGLDNRPVARRHSPRAHAASGAQAFTAAKVAQIYRFPTGFDGTGQTIGIIELGGGYRPSDLDTYFSGLGLATPTVIPISVDGGTNAPSSASSDDSEVVLDIEVAGAAAPGAKIVVYFAPNDAASNGFLDALTKAVHDTENNPSVISISWGGPESIPTTSFQTQFDQALQAAAMLGITVCVAAGDNGAADEGPNEWDGKAHVDFPSASPFALSCGGTRLIAANGAIKAESVWNQNQADVPDDTFGSGGGGVSGAFPPPPYQQQANVPVSLNPQGAQGRGVPDVTGDGDPDTGYNILVDGQPEQVGGTSAVAPLWAALIALINQKLNGRVGFVNSQLYALANSGAFHDITVGNNRVSFQQFNNIGYDAGPGWDAASGLGSPDGTALSGLLKAGTPVATPGVLASKGQNPKRPTRAKIGRSAASTKSRHKQKVRARK
jgi:kumamolisin